MEGLLDFSEIGEAAEIITELVRDGRGLAQAVPPPASTTVSTLAASRVEPSSTQQGTAVEARDPEVHSTYRADRLEHIVGALCRRAGFEAAVVADADGLPLAAHNSPVAIEHLAAATSVLGASLTHTARLLGRAQLDAISVDVGYADKAVLRRFSAGNASYYLMILCRQDLDERSEVELSTDQLKDELLRT